MKIIMFVVCIMILVALTIFINTAESQTDSVQIAANKDMQNKCSFPELNKKNIRAFVDCLETSFGNIINNMECGSPNFKKAEAVENICMLEVTIAKFNESCKKEKCYDESSLSFMKELMDKQKMYKKQYKDITAQYFKQKYCEDKTFKRLRHDWYIAEHYCSFVDL
jgi:hypothetical protein